MIEIKTVPGEGITATPVDKPEAQIPADAAAPAAKTDASAPAADAATPNADAAPAAKEGDSAKPDGQEGKDDDKNEDGTPKKKGGGFQNRIDKLTREKHEAQLRAQTAEAELAKLREGAGKPDSKALPDGSPDPSKYEDPAEYVKAVAEKAVAEDRAARAQQEAKQAQEAEASAIAGSWEKRVQAGVEKYKDFQEALNSPVPVHPAVQRAIMQSPIGEEVAYFLGKNPDKAEALVGLPLERQLAEIGKIEVSLEASLTKKEGSKPVSKAPAPATPVSGTASSAPLDINNVKSQAEFKKMMKEAGVKFAGRA